MIKVTAIIRDENGMNHSVSAWVDEATNAVLNQVDSDTRTQYILDEYQSQLVERKETRRVQSLDVLTDSGFDVAAEAVDRELIQTVRDAIAQLPTEYGIIVGMLYYKGMKQTEIAKALNVSPSAVSQKIQTINAHLKEKLKNIF